MLALAYIGGMFENSGCVCFKRYRAANGKIYATVTVAVTHRDRRCLDFMVETFGAGSVSFKDRKRSPGFLRFQVVGKNGLRVIEEIRPFVIAKRAHIDAAVRAYWDADKQRRRVKRNGRALKDDKLQISV